MATAHRIFPHGPAEQIAEGLWQVCGSLSVPLPRNMTIWRLPSGGLLLYSVVALDEPGMAALEALGRPEIMVVPHAMHCMDAPFYQRRYPGLRVVALDDGARNVGKLGVTSEGAPDEVLPALGVRCFTVPGLKYGEVALELPLASGGHALQVTDCIATFPPKGLVMRLLGPPGGIPATPRIVRWRQVSDPRAVARFLRERAAAEPRLLLVAHGPAITDGVRALLENAAGSLGG